MCRYVHLCMGMCLWNFKPFSHAKVLHNKWENRPCVILTLKEKKGEKTSRENEKHHWIMQNQVFAVALCLNLKSSRCFWIQVTKELNLIGKKTLEKGFVGLPKLQLSRSLPIYWGKYVAEPKIIMISWQP